MWYITLFFFLFPSVVGITWRQNVVKILVVRNQARSDGEILEKTVYGNYYT